MNRTKRISRRGFWFLSYCVITLVSVIINMLGYSVAQKVLKDDLEKNSLNSLKSMQKIYDSYFQEIFDASYNILQSYSVGRLSSNAEMSSWLKQDCIKNISTNIQNVMCGNHVIEECILTINHKDLGISSMGSTDTRSIYDIYFKEYYQNINDWKRDMINVQGKKICFLKDKNGNPVLHMVYGIQWLNSGQTVIVKINGRIMNSYLKNSGKDNEKYYITDLNDNEIFTSDTNYPKRKRDVLISIRSDLFELKYHKVMPGDIYLKNILRVRNFFILSYLLCIFIGCAIAYWFSGVLERRQKHAEEILAKQEELLRRHKLKQILVGELGGRAAEELFDAYKAELYRNGYVVILFEFSESKETETLSITERLAIQTYIERYFNCITPNAITFFCEINKNCIGIIKLEDEIDAVNKLYMRCEEVINELERTTPANVVCSVSQVFYDITQVHTAYEQTKEIISFRFFGDEKKVFVYDDILECGFSYDVTKERRLINCVLCGEKDEALKIIDNIYCLNEKKDITIGTLRILTFQLINSVTLAKERFRNSEINYRKLYKLFLAVNEAQTAEELKQIAVASMIDILSQKAGEIKNDYSAKYQNIVKYIEENYANQMLNVNMIAEVFDINRNWLSEVFKKKFGEGIADYIVKYRLEKAKELLKQGVMVHKVAEKVGFSSTVVFTRAFKKFEGITPGQYKAIMANNMEAEMEVNNGDLYGRNSEVG